MHRQPALAMGTDPMPSEAPRGSDEACRKAIRLLERRERSRSELTERLLREGFASDDVEMTISWLQEKGLQSDVRFAESLVRDRIARGYGERKIAYELSRHGISLSDVPGYPEDFVETDEDDRAREVLRAHPVTSADRQAGAYRRLMAKGYPTAVAARISSEYAEGIS